MYSENCVTIEGPRSKVV